MGRATRAAKRSEYHQHPRKEGKAISLSRVHNKAKATGPPREGAAAELDLAAHLSRESNTPTGYCLVSVGEVTSRLTEVPRARLQCRPAQKESRSNRQILDCTNGWPHDRTEEVCIQMDELAQKDFSHHMTQAEYFRYRRNWWISLSNSRTSGPLKNRSDFNELSTLHHLHQESGERQLRPVPFWKYQYWHQSSSSFSSWWQQNSDSFWSSEQFK